VPFAVQVLKKTVEDKHLARILNEVLAGLRRLWLGASKQVRVVAYLALSGRCEEQRGPKSSGKKWQGGERRALGRADFGGTRETLRNNT